MLGPGRSGGEHAAGEVPVTATPQTTNTIVAFSTSRCPERSSTRLAAEMPPKMPSSRASRRAISSASAWETSTVRSTAEGSKILGTYSGGHARMPGILDLGRLCPDDLHLFNGSYLQKMP